MRQSRHPVILPLMILYFTLVAPQAVDTSSSGVLPKPPQTRAENVVIDYFGTKVSDPYRWMEAGAEDPAVLAFLKAQNDYTRAVLAFLATPLNKLLSRIQELDNAVPTVRGWQRAGSAIFYLETPPECLDCIPQGARNRWPTAHPA
jgi:prolyl oligopeptidase